MWLLPYFLPVHPGTGRLCYTSYSFRAFPSRTIGLHFITGLMFLVTSWGFMAQILHNYCLGINDVSCTSNYAWLALFLLIIIRWQIGYDMFLIQVKLQESLLFGTWKLKVSKYMHCSILTWLYKKQDPSSNFDSQWWNNI